MADQTNTAPAVDPKAEAQKKADEARNAALKRVSPEVVPLLRQASELHKQIAETFRAEGLDKDAEFYDKQVERHDKMAGWYDPKTKKDVKIARLKEQLAKLEAEAEAEAAAAENAQA